MAHPVENSKTKTASALNLKADAVLFRVQLCLSRVTSAFDEKSFGLAGHTSAMF
jgi:hypothetical protein